MRHKGMDLTELAQGMIKQWDFVNMVINLQLL
jgi:hypothetical protein